MISIKDLRVKYKDTVIENFNLKIEKNGIYCLLSPSGAGKTTLLNAVSKLIKFDGEIKVDGEIRLIDTWVNAKSEPNINAQGKNVSFALPNADNQVITVMLKSGIGNNEYKFLIRNKEG